MYLIQRRHQLSMLLRPELLDRLRMTETMQKESELMAISLDKVRPQTPSSESDKGVDMTETCTPARKKHRRGKHKRRRWKPYSLMTAEEKRELEEREAARAVKREAKLASKPSAPWNTTQFLMEDRGSTEVHLPMPRTSRTLSVESSLSDEEYYESPEDDAFEHGLFMERDFEDTYEAMASEHLQGMSKIQLVDECLNLQRERDQCREELSALKKKISELTSNNDKLTKEIEKQMPNGGHIQSTTANS